MAVRTENEENIGGKVALGAGIGAATGSAIGALLTRGPKAGASPPPGITVVSLDAATMALLQAIKADSDKMTGQLAQLIALLTPGTAPPSVIGTPDKFGKDNQAILPATTFDILNEGSGAGALVWFIVDVQNPAVIIHIILDSVQYDFDMAQMILEGLMAPAYPGAWITRADPIGPPPTFCMMFSIGTLNGYPYKNRINISVENTTAANIQLNHAYGIKWIYS